MASPILPNRKSIQVCIRLDEPNEDTSDVTTIQNTYDKSTSNYLLQSKHNQLSLKFQDKNNQTKDSINSSAENIRKTFQDIKTIAGGFGSVFEIDWDFWSQVVNDYDHVVNHESEKLNQSIIKGIPKEFRGIIWQLVTKSKEYQLEDFYRQLKLENSIHEKAIKRDLSRTSFFTNVEAVSKGDELFNVIKAYSLYDPDVGYTQGMIFIAVPLIMNMHESECFCLLVTLMKEYGLRELFCPEMKGLHVLLYEFDRVLESYSPVLYNHLVKQGIKSSMYASQWFLTFFAYKFPLDIVLRIYDIIVTQGMESILKFAVNLMIQNESNLLALSFDKLLEFLKDKLFNVYVNDAFVKDDKGKKRFSLSRAPSAPTTYYKLDALVQDSMLINVDPVDLSKYEKEFEGIYNKERAKVDDIKAMRVANGNLRHRIKELQSQYSDLTRDHVDVVQKMVDLKITLPELMSENDDLSISIEKLQKDIEELESKTQPANDVLPNTLETQIQELLVINAQHVETSANLEDELNTLLEEEAQLDDELKKSNRNSTWFNWSK
ncbi:GYP5 GTPase-activating protein GYP5 [Candida maltosa Xu316]